MATAEQIADMFSRPYRATDPWLPIKARMVAYGKRREVPAATMKRAITLAKERIDSVNAAWKRAGKPRKVANPSHSGLTAHDKSVVRRVARQILDDRDMGEESIEGDNVVLSSGYASVDVSDSGETIYVTRNRRTVRVKMHEGRKGPSRVANPYPGDNWPRDTRPKQRPIKVRVALYTRSGKLEGTHTVVVRGHSSEHDAKQRAKQSLRGTVHYDTGMTMKATIARAKARKRSSR